MTPVPTDTNLTSLMVVMVVVMSAMVDMMTVPTNEPHVSLKVAQYLWFLWSTSVDVTH